MAQSGGINSRIVAKIKNLNAEEGKKKFLLQMLGFELEVANETMPRYTQEYLQAIERYMAKSRDDVNVD